jgi:hypothetical protein
MSQSLADYDDRIAGSAVVLRPAGDRDAAGGVLRRPEWPVPARAPCTLMLRASPDKTFQTGTETRHVAALYQRQPQIP